MKTIFNNPKRVLMAVKKAVFVFTAALLTTVALTTQKASAQTGCVTGCTSNDVQIQRAYLMADTSGTPLSSNCTFGTSVNAYLYLDLVTNTPRVGVSISGKVVHRDSSTVILGQPSQCFGQSLTSTSAQPVTTVKFKVPINWRCGTPIVLKDVLIGWGTGNTNFCTSDAAQCPATKSKCWRQGPTDHIAIVTPISVSCSATACSNQPGGNTAIFNLSALENTVKGGQVNVTVRWYSNSALTNKISTPSAYTSSSGTVYAKVMNTSDTTSFSSSQVTLTVNTTPVAHAASATLCATSSGVSTASFNLSSLEATVKGSQSNVSVSWFTGATLHPDSAIATPAAFVSGTSTVYAKVTNSSATSCFSKTAVPLTVNLKPANAQVNVTQPTCASANGSVTVTSPLDGNGIDYEYSNNGGSYQESPTFTVAANGNYSIIARNKNGNCTSATAATGTMGAQPATPNAPTASVTQPTCSVATGSIIVTAPTGAGITYSINGTDYQSGTTFSGLAPGNYNVTAKANGCVSSATSKTISSQPDTPPAPTICVVQPDLCGPSTGSITVISPTGAGYQYSKDNGQTWQTSTSFSGLAAGSNPSIIVKNGSGCISSGTSCGDASVCQSNVRLAGPAPKAVSDGSASEQQLLAYPVPFHDKVTISFTAEHSENYVINLYDMRGNLVKQLKSGNAGAGEKIEIEVDGSHLSESLYIARKVSKSGISTVKLLKEK